MRRILHLYGVELSGCVFLGSVRPGSGSLVCIWMFGARVSWCLGVSIVVLYGIRSFRLVPWRLTFVVSLIVGDWGRAFCRGACVGLRALSDSHFRTTGVRLRYDMIKS